MISCMIFCIFLNTKYTKTHEIVIFYNFLTEASNNFKSIVLSSVISKLFEDNNLTDN